MNGYLAVGPGSLLSHQGRIAFLRQPLSEEESKHFRQARELDPDRIHPLYFIIAIGKGYLRILKYLISRVDPSTLNSEEWIYRASEYDHSEVIKYLLSIGIKGGEKAIPILSGHGNLEVLKLLVLRFGLSKHILHQAFVNAYANGHLQEVRFLTSEGANITFLSTAFAAERGHFSIVKYLVAQGVKVPSDVERYIRNRSRAGSLKSLEFLKLDKRARDKKAYAFLRSLYFTKLVKKL